jgi:hypothetical protein
MAARDFVPTARMAANARLGLELRERFGRGGTEVGVRRAHQLIAREQLDPGEIKSMYSYFARHAVDKQTRSHVWARAPTLPPATSPGCSGAATRDSAGRR